MKFTDLYREMLNNTEIIRTLISNMPQEEARLKPTPDSWSILEVICHLYDEEKEDFREHLDFILHRQNEEWHRIDPQDWVTSRKYNEKDFMELRNKFFEERRKSLDWLKNLSNADWDITYISEYGSIPAGAMFASWVAHDNLHIRQLVELKHDQIQKLSQPYLIEYAGEW
jgi:hypothetical protein